MSAEGQIIPLLRVRQGNLPLPLLVSIVFKNVGQSQLVKEKPHYVNTAKEETVILVMIISFMESQRNWNIFGTD